MRLNVIKLGHEQTTTDRFQTRLESTADGRRNYRRQATESRPVGAVASPPRRDPGTDGHSARGRTSLGAPLPAAVSPRPQNAGRPAQEMGWPTARVAELGRRTSVPGSLGGTGSAGRSVIGFAFACGLGRKAGPEGSTFGAVPIASPAWMAQSRSRHPTPKSDPVAQAEWKKNFPKRWQPY